MNIPNIRLGIVSTAISMLKYPGKLFSDEDDPHKEELRNAFICGYYYGYMKDCVLYDPNTHFEEFYKTYMKTKGE